jgi:lipoprotein-anchoring transpeptidase ErfK/SrfK
MKTLLSICVFLISTASIATAQQRAATVSRAQTREAESRLTEMGYWSGAVDGVFDSASHAALIAFQKWEGRPLTGKLTTEEFEAIRTAAPPKARDGAYEHVEVDLDRQVLLIVDDQGRVRVLPVSTGTGKEFFYDGQMSVAYTPRGRFVVYEKGVGWENNVPGSMYYPNYISGGIAIHGSYSVPTQPASHGCIRIPMFAARDVSKLLKLGTIVLVYDKVSFVSAKSWIENPKLKEAALAKGGQQ